MHDSDMKVRGGRCSKLAAMFGQDMTFRAWYDLRKDQPVGTAQEADIKQFFYRACRVTSRAMIDNDPYAYQMFQKIRNEYLSDIRSANQYQREHNKAWRCGAVGRYEDLTS